MTGVLPFDISAVPASIKNIFANAGGYYCFSICLFVLFLSLFSRSVHNKTGVKKKQKRFENKGHRSESTLHFQEPIVLALGASV